MDEEAQRTRWDEERKGWMALVDQGGGLYSAWHSPVSRGLSARALRLHCAAALAEQEQESRGEDSAAHRHRK